MMRAFRMSSRSGGYADLCDEIRGLGYSKIVFTNGCFDIIHVGHINTLNFAKSVAGRHGAVVVGINSDESVTRLKGDARPITCEEERATVLMSLRSVDHVVSFDEDTPYELILKLMPDVIVKGGDYERCDVVGCDVANVMIAPYCAGTSTTELIERIRNGWKVPSRR